MWYWTLSAIIAAWVVFDAKNRKMKHYFFWGLATFILMLFVTPFYFAKRHLKENETREGGTAWNVIKTFAIYWTVLMFAAGISGINAASQIVDHNSSTAELTGASIGTVLGAGMIMSLWFMVLVGSLVIGLFLKKSSVVEKGPTGGLKSANHHD